MAQVRSKRLNSVQIGITLNKNSPSEMLLIEAWEEKTPVMVGHGDFAVGAEILRRLLVRGLADLVRELPHAFDGLTNKHCKEVVQSLIKESSTAPSKRSTARLKERTVQRSKPANSKKTVTTRKRSV